MKMKDELLLKQNLDSNKEKIGDTDNLLPVERNDVSSPRNNNGSIESEYVE